MVASVNVPDFRLLAPVAAGISRAVEILNSGGLVAFPTETVYGLGADARRSDAVLAIFAAKGRPRSNPLIVHVLDGETAEAIAAFNPEAVLLADAFWPGPLTLVLPRRIESGLAAEVAGGLATAAVRVPSHPVARSILKDFAGPVAGPSANPSGRVSPTEAAHVLEDLGCLVDAVVDGGPCTVGIESAIVSFGARGPVLLREGGIARGALEAAMGRAFVPAPASGRPQVPGSSNSHYAPSASLRIDAEAPAPGEGWLGFGPEPAEIRHAAVARNLSRTGNVPEAASRLFSCLRELDSAMGGSGCIAVRAIPDRGLGAAVNDRLRRASAPRS